MKRRFFTFLITIFILLFSSLFTDSRAEENPVALKINSINFDNSDSIIFLGTSKHENLDEYYVSKKLLKDPDRIFFDIENAVLTIPNMTYELKNSKLSTVKIAQFSSKPNVVRVVITYQKNYDVSKIKLNVLNNNIIIKLDNTIPKQAYLTQVYRETKESPYDYNEKTTVRENKNADEKDSQPRDEIYNQVRSAFNDSEEGMIVRPNIEQKQARLTSRYFINNFTSKSGNILVNGIGVINLQAPVTLTNPTRVVYDFPNTIVAQNLRNKELKISAYESAKIAQFEPSKARLVITTNFPYKYKPIYSFDLQSMLIAHTERIKDMTFSNTNSKITYYKSAEINSNSSSMNIMFSNPVVYSISKINNELEIYFYNLINFNIQSFNSMAKVSRQENIHAYQISPNQYVLKIQLPNNTKTDCYETLNATQLKFNFAYSAKSQTTASEQTVKKNIVPKITIPKIIKSKDSISKSIKKKIIILDAGHGGKDTGAIKGGINEKDLTIKIALLTKAILDSKGFTNVYLTRSSDETLTLEDRVNFANSKQSDVFVSIHLNSSVKPEIHGIETHYYTESGFKMARVVHAALKANIKETDRGLFKSKFYVINHTVAPAILLELGFLSNTTERNELLTKERQEISANAIAEGIIDYLSEEE